MGFKDWPSWLKGGVIGVILSFIVALPIITYNLGFKNINILSSISVILILPGLIIFQILTFFIPQIQGCSLFYLGMENTPLCPGGTFMMITTIILNSFIYLIGGALIGFLLGKLKSKNQQVNPKNRVTKG